MLSRIADGDDDAIDELPENMDEGVDVCDGPQCKGYISHKEADSGDWIKPHKMKGK